MPLLSQVAFNDSVSVGNVITLCLLIGIFFYVYVQTRKDMALVTIQGWIDKHEKEAEKKEISSEARLKATENAIIQLTAIQETMKDHLNAIDRRHDRMDEKRAL
jgi:hypothetical protein